MWSIHLSASQKKKKKEADRLLGQPKSTLFAFGLAQVFHNGRKPAFFKAPEV